MNSVLKSLRALVTAFALVAGIAGLQVVTVATATTAQAAAGPVQDRRDVTADSLPTVQINGVVWRQLVVGNTVFVGGEFSKARPAGSAVGVNEVPRTNFLAYDLTTGVLMNGFNPVFNAKVKSLAVSPDGTKLYVGGSFTTVNGQTRNRIAAFDVATGDLLPFAASFNSTVNAIVPTDTAVYVGGLFSYSGSTQRFSLAALNPTTGALLPWAPKTNGYVQAMVRTPDGSRLVLGGNFSTVNDIEAKGLSSITIADGATQPFAINQVIQNTGDSQSVLSLQLDSEGNVYGTAFAYGGPGPFFEGVFAANAMTGDVKWLADCHGDSYDAARLGQTVYSVSHHHYCVNIGGFPDTNPRLFWQRANAFSAEVTGTVNDNGQGGYPNFGGQPAPSLLTWFPLVPAGTYTGQTQAGWTLTTTDKYVLMGGEFPSVNGVGQQGLARFAMPSIAPKKVGPTLTGSATAPAPIAVTPDRVRIKFPSNWDRDNYTLNYALYREGTAAPIYTSSSQTVWWKLPSQSFDDTSVHAGTTYRYRVVTTDPDGNSVTSPWASVAVPSSIHAYPAAVMADGASHYWRMGAPGSWPDYVGAMDQSTSGSVVATQGAITGDSSQGSSFDGATGYSYSLGLETGPSVFTAEAWFKTTTTAGGKILGFGNGTTGSSGSYDRHVYMTNDGKITFGVYPNAVRVVSTAKAYNDGDWHQVVASLSSAGMRLYVDGLLVAQRGDTTSAQAYEGAWRIGGDSIGGWPSQPSSQSFAGAIDDVAIYPTAVSTAVIRDHYTKSGRTVAVPPLPTDSLGAAVSADEPDLMWRFNDTTGAALDQTGNGSDGVVNGGVGRSQTSPIAPGTAYGFNGSDAQVSTPSPQAGPNAYSTELWFTTTTTQGGRLIGFGDSPTGSSSNYDRHIYLDPSGQVNFGVWTGFSNVITSAQSYNDGNWHHVVATQGAEGMALYLDGVRVGTNPQTAAQDYSGYWRVGGDSTWAGVQYFAGTIDEVAVYSRPLPIDRVRAHYRASGAAVNRPPTGASLTSQCNTAGACSFTGAASDVDGNVTDGVWDFGDGSSAGSGLTPTHSYSASGAYSVKFTAVDDQGGQSAQVSSNVQVTVVAANVPPKASFTQDCADRVCSFSDTSTDSDGSVVGWAWDFGDGSTSTSASQSHTYTNPGTYTVKLLVTDNSGATDSVQKDLTFVPPNQSPTAAFTATLANLKVTVDASGADDSDGTVQSYAWDFGDGSTATTKVAQHTYATAGDYTISLVVTDNDGAESSAVTKQVTVAPAPNQAPKAAFIATSSGLSVSLDAADSKDDDGTIASYQWTLSDGGTASGKTTSHAFATAGTYTVTLKVTDNDGATDTAIKSVTVSAAIVSDNFNRTASNWGSADVGGTWTYQNPSYFSTDGNTGVIRLPSAGARGTANLTNVSVRDQVVTATIKPGETTGSGVQSTFILRANGNNDYRLTVQFHGDKSVRLNWTKRVDNVSTSFGDVKVNGLTYATGDVLRVRISAIGSGTTSLQAKVWKDGAIEPANSQFTASDSSTALQAAGSFSISHYLTGSATVVPVLMRVDDLQVTSV